MLRFDRIKTWPRTMIIAHRGAGHRGKGATIHENTIAAFKQAIAVGADAIELDVRRTADGVLIIHHDERITRSRHLISRLTLAEIHERAAAKGYCIPTFAEALETCAGRIALDIELKEGGYEADVTALTRRYYDLRHVAFTSFDDFTIRRIKEIVRAAVTGLLLGVEPLAGPGARVSEIFPIRRVRRCGADFVAPNRGLVHLGYIQRAERAALPIVVWTVNGKARAGRLITRSVAGIITDVPDRLLTEIEK